ncbi:hypothetical protein ASPCAL01345 [Aspergillus calidoustus]|uniref:Uncharacterized protein n=1 Tax=Aspergillus calidoustus TaxID=454130 RepID=A0A0U5FT00_ASPCI|nr:hypothetical protein ASPCAL01345 [Aspergillus calidoustus]
MHPELSAPSPQRTPFKGAAPLRPVRLGRWSVPLLATIAIATSPKPTTRLKSPKPSASGRTSSSWMRTGTRITWTIFKKRWKLMRFNE